MNLLENQERARDVVKALPAAAEGCGAGPAIALVAEEASKLSDEARDLMHTGRSPHGLERKQAGASLLLLTFEP